MAVKHLSHHIVAQGGARLLDGYSIKWTGKKKKKKKIDLFFVQVFRCF